MPAHAKSRWSSLRSGIVPLRAQTDGDVRDVYWFANRAFLGKAPPNEPVSWTPQQGSYEVTALDDRGDRERAR